MRTVIKGVILFLAYYAALYSNEPSKGTYFNQPLPADVPERFAPDLLTFPQGYHSAVSFNHDLTIAVWSEMRREHNMMISTCQEGVWTHPESVDFGFEEGVGDGVFRPASSQLYFLANRNEQSQKTSREYLWRVSFSERWQTPEILSPSVGQYNTHWNCSVSARGTLYFTVEESQTSFNQDIYRAIPEQRGYEQPTPLNDSINTSALELSPCIAPDESFLLFSRRSPDKGDMDLFISNWDEKTGWLFPERLQDPINSDRHDLCPILSPDGQLLFFLSQRNGKSLVYWVQTSAFLGGS